MRSGSRVGMGVEPGLEDEGGGDPVADFSAAISPHSGLDEHPFSFGGAEPLVLEDHLPAGLTDEAGTEMAHTVGLLPFLPSRCKWQSCNDFFDVVVREHGLDGGAVRGQRTALDHSHRLCGKPQRVTYSDANTFVSHVQCG